MDTEATPLKECSAIEIDGENFKILDVYHRYANSGEDGESGYSHTHVHGLNSDFLSENGFATEQELIDDFKNWIASKNYRKICCNDPTREREIFKDLCFEDLKLPMWSQRSSQSYHVTANSFKGSSVPILNTSCSWYAHRDFRTYPKAPRTSAQLARAMHGYHCSLYDSYELYLYYILYKDMYEWDVLADL